MSEAMVDVAAVARASVRGPFPWQRGESLLIGPYRVLRGNRPLALLTLGYACSSLGSWLTLISLSVLVYGLSHSAVLVALATLALTAPPALCAPLVGLLVDRVPPCRLLVAAHTACAPCLLGLAFVHSQATLWLAFPLAVVTSVLAAAIRPAVAAALLLTLPALLRLEGAIAVHPFLRRARATPCALPPVPAPSPA